MKLTKSKIAALPFPTDKDQVFYWDDELKGFGVRVTKSKGKEGTKSYVVRGTANGKDRRYTLARCNHMSCEEARKLAQAKLVEMHQGIDPQHRKKELLAKSETLQEIAEDYIKNHRTKHGELSAKSILDIKSCLNNTFSDWLHKPVADITRDDCLKRFRERSKVAPTQANQNFRNLRALLNWAREKYATNDGQYPILAINHFSKMFNNSGFAKWNFEKPRKSRVHKDKIGLVWQLLVRFATSVEFIASTQTSADLVAFLLLTGTRLNEACQLTWDRVDLKSCPATFYLANTKNHNPITLPISSVLYEVLTRRYEKRVRGNKYVFPAPTGKKGYLSDPRALLRKLSEAIDSHIHPHALRRTFEDMAQLCEVNSDQRRQLLNHLASDGHGQAYANNPDPAVLLPAVEKISLWVVGQAEQV